MQTLTITAISLESAQGFIGALSNFNTELIQTGGGSYQVQIALGRGDREVVAVLLALENYVTSRGEGPTEVGLYGRTYKLHPTDPPSSAPAIAT